METAREFWNKRIKEAHRGVAIGDLDWENVRHREMMKQTAKEDAQRIRLLRMARRQ